MMRTAIGLQMHSGWGVLVAVSFVHQTVEVLARQRIVTVDSDQPGAHQPYHHVAHHDLPDVNQYLADRALASTRLAEKAIGEQVRELKRKQCQLVGAAILLASGRPLPALAKILASHPLLHTAEGEFFRQTARQACEGLHIPVTSIRERELDQKARAALGNAAGDVVHTIAGLGSVVGPPWTRDHKTAALAGVLVLSAHN